MLNEWFCKSILQVNIIRIILLVWHLFSWGTAVCSLIITMASAASIYNPVACVDEIAMLPGLISFKIYCHLSNAMSYTPGLNWDLHSDLASRRLYGFCSSLLSISLFIWEILYSYYWRNYFFFSRGKQEAGVIALILAINFLISVTFL